MNINVMARGMMTKRYTPEDFIQHVASMIEGQLQEWDAKYEVFLMKFQDYQLVVKKGNIYYDVFITEEAVSQLQAEEAFMLDRVIWLALQEQGLPIYKGLGNYMDKVFLGM
mgnify:FL=1